MHALALALLMLAAEPLSLHPENPHYLQFRGKPTILVTSGEHYGAVLNRDFDFEPYLNILAADSLNLTRTFSGTYREVPGSFNIPNNTLAPKPGRYAAPWVKKGDKYDLDAIDPEYVNRLKTFLRAASERGIVVEYVLFCTFYDDGLWDIDPMNAKNNLNGVGAISREEVLTLKHPDLLAKQKDFVRKIVKELNEFDNVYFEICNEPYFAGVALDWQHAIAETIAETEKSLPNKHLIAQNIANDKAKVDHPDPLVSIFNFHYATPPETVAMNYGLNRPIADDETGFRGTEDDFYRNEAWEFLLAGGSIFSNLDYSFTPDQEDGSAKVEAPTPGGGGATFRKQMGVLKRFVEGFDFIHMKPSDDVITSRKLAGDARVHVLGQEGKAYAIYVSKGPRAELSLKLPNGAYRAEWIDPISGKSLGTQEFQAGDITLSAPEFGEGIALSIRAK
jgi:hypothetical protein